MEQKLRTLLFDTVKPNHLEEVARLMRYIEDGCPSGEPLFLSLGETWEHTPGALTKLLGEVPSYVHGYQLSMYGLPDCRQAVSTYLRRDHRLPLSSRQGVDYEVGMTWTGTRNAMYDFGRLLKDQYFKRGAPAFITAAPGWDYVGVFGPLGFKGMFIDLPKASGFMPESASFTESIEKSSKQKQLLIINAQHNPTSINWSPVFVRDLIRLGLAKSFAILIDDAHFGVHDPDVTPTSALRILLEELPNFPKYRQPWFATRSFGKQFSVNGWGLGSLVSSPDTLDLFANTYRTQHIYNYGGAQQYALSRWLNTDSATEFLRKRNVEIAANKRHLVRAFVDRFGYPESEVFPGNCTNFLLFSVPPAYAAIPTGVKVFLQDFLGYGIILTDAWPKPYDSPAEEGTYKCIRMYAGASAKTVDALIGRLEKYGFHYTMSAAH